ncbi:hypothetical protein OHAE_4722 [Ochrobactrum soli]|uniref:Uncharacterized protein n=1 Tax=Ochrobactrum soli TaxID=2448455 RepID=A0A2P9HDM6_9HYPH|nr:hypothetical protein OHAE_4722 [[Ochrobactrum] soli]
MRVENMPFGETPPTHNQPMCENSVQCLVERCCPENHALSFPQSHAGSPKLFL